LIAEKEIQIVISMLQINLLVIIGASHITVPGNIKAGRDVPLFKNNN
jgi:hypothetical protein